MGKGGPRTVFLSANTLCLYHLQYWLALSLYNWLQIPLVFCFVWYAGEVPGEIIGAPPLRSVSPTGGPRATSHGRPIGPEAKINRVSSLENRESYI